MKKLRICYAFPQTFMHGNNGMCNSDFKFKFTFRNILRGGDFNPISFGNNDWIYPSSLSSSTFLTLINLPERMKLFEVFVI